jgi:hypothetical protein
MGSNGRGLVCVVKANGLKWLNANDSHPSIFSKRALAKEWRFMGMVYARSNGLPQYEQANVTAIIHRNNERTKSDVLNWADTVKPLIDGFTDAGCWPDDDNAHLKVDLRAGETWEKSGVEMIITPAGRSRPEVPEAMQAKLRLLRDRKLLSRKRRDAKLEV